MADFIQIESFCKKELIEKLEEENMRRRRQGNLTYDTYCFDRTYYIKIDEYENISISQTPHILQSAQRCIIIYKWSQLAMSQFYETYKICYIDEDGSVSDPCIIDFFKIHISNAYFNNSASITLSFINKKLITIKPLQPIEMSMKFIWSLYKLCKGKTFDEAQSICDVEAKKLGII
jgi:hypothetical protein